MHFSSPKLFAGLALVATLSLSGCSATPTASTSTQPSQSSSSSAAETPSSVLPTVAPSAGTQAVGSLIDESAYLAAMKPLGFKCDASVVKAVEFSGTQVEFSTIACRRGVEPDVVLTLAANQNELELVTIQSCKSVTGTQSRTPIVEGGNWQLLSAASDRPLLEQLAKILQGKTMTISELCS